MLQRQSASWLSALITVYATEILAKPRIQGLREEVEAWATKNKADVSYTNVTIGKDFLSFSLNLMYPSCPRGEEISDSEYLDHLMAAMNTHVYDMISKNYDGYLCVYVKVNNHLCAMLE